MPEDVEMPAPVKTTTRFALMMASETAACAESEALAVKTLQGIAVWLVHAETGLRTERDFGCLFLAKESARLVT